MTYYNNLTKHTTKSFEIVFLYIEISEISVANGIIKDHNHILIVRLIKNIKFAIFNLNIGLVAQNELCTRFKIIIVNVLHTLIINHRISIIII